MTASPPGGQRPDSPEAEAFLPSPNHGERRGRGPDMLLLHYTGMSDGEVALARLCDPEAEVSAHYMVFEDGRTVQLVREVRRAWHAGAGSWAGDDDVNSCSIGIEIVNRGHEGGLPPYPDVQIAAVIRLARDIVARHAIRPERVLAHSDIAPDRKEDPGEHFPWDRLAAEGIGHWVGPAPITDGPTSGPGDRASRIEAFQMALARYGYVIDPTGILDDPTFAVVTAFQRHFRPERVDGRIDPSTIATLERLIEALPSP